jgi:hypothetical protein
VIHPCEQFIASRDRWMERGRNIVYSGCEEVGGTGVPSLVLHP